MSSAAGFSDLPPMTAAPTSGQSRAVPCLRLGSRCCSRCGWRTHVRIRNGTGWRRRWCWWCVQFRFEKFFSLQCILIIGIDFKDFVYVGQGGLEIALRLVDEGAHLIIL